MTTELHNVDPATELDLIDDDHDCVLIGFDFAEFEDGVVSLWVKSNEDHVPTPGEWDPTHEVGSISRDDETDETLVELYDPPFKFLTGRVSIMRPFGAKKASQDTLQAWTERDAWRLK